MDLTIPVEDKILNIRVAVILKTKNGYVIEKSKDGYFFIVGGRIKINESSEEAAKRETLEETGIKIDNIKLKAIIENFYINERKQQVQEICFVYTTNEVDNLELMEGLGEYTLEQINTMDFRPSSMKQVMTSNNDEILHISHRG